MAAQSLHITLITSPLPEEGLPTADSAAVIYLFLSFNDCLVLITESQCLQKTDLSIVQLTAQAQMCEMPICCK